MPGGKAKRSSPAVGGKEGRERWVMAGRPRIYDILDVGAASLQSAATVQVKRWDATGCELSERRQEGVSAERGPQS